VGGGHQRIAWPPRVGVGMATEALWHFGVNLSYRQGRPAGSSMSDRSDLTFH